MEIGSGTRLGQYEVHERLGTGGMGEVWVAEDTRLSRKVAIKVLPAELGAEPDRLARLEREARLLAQLNHPNIATVYGFESEGDVHYVAMELAPGSPLDELLAGGPLEQAQAREVALQVARALEAAHERGVIHRDLKPANVVVDTEGDSGTTVKVLDFGLAKAFEPDGSASSLSPELTASPTVVAATAAGVILGTAAYMSPEQARGKAVDKRADIWAFGVVLYEMLTGQRLFEGETVSDVLAAVLRQEPDLDRLPAGTPPAIRRLLGRCLERDPQQRLRDIGEARILLAGDHSEAPPLQQADASSSSALRTTVLTTIVGLAALALGLLLGGGGEETGSRTLHVALDVAPADWLAAEDYESRPFRSAVAVTPDGESVIFAGSLDGAPRLYRRQLEETVARPLPGTEGANLLTLSPDGREVAFMADGELRRMTLDGAEPRTIADVAELHERLPSPTGGFTSPERNLYGLTWSEDGNLYLARFEGGLVRVPARGGEGELVAGSDEHSYIRNPHALPGGGALLFDATASESILASRKIVYLDLQSGESRIVLEGAADPEYVPGVGLLFWSNDALQVTEFDPDDGAISGISHVVADDVLIGLGGPSPGTVSATAQYAIGGETLVFAAGGRQRPVPGELEIITPAGDRTTLDLPATNGYFGPGVIDAGRVMLTRRPDDSGDFAAGILDLTRNTFTQLSPDGAWYTQPDPTRGRALNVRDGLRAIPLDGSAGFETIAGTPEGVTGAALRAYVHRVAPDGSLLAMLVNRSETEGDVVLFDLEGDRGFIDFAATPAAEGYPSFSRDSRWVVYTSDASGRDEVYLSPIDGGGRIQISTDGGLAPLFSPDGESITYWHRREESGWDLYRVAVTLGSEPSAGRPGLLFSAPYSGLVGLNNYDVLPDGRFIVTVLGELRPRPVETLNVILGWQGYVERLRAE